MSCTRCWVLGEGGRIRSGLIFVIGENGVKGERLCASTHGCVGGVLQG